MVKTPTATAAKFQTQNYKSLLIKTPKDFITFKTNLLIDETKGDPVKRAGLIKDIVESISLIPDPVIRSVYVQECSRIMTIDEQILHAEVNKLRRKSKEKANEKSTEPEGEPTIIRSGELSSEYEPLPQGNKIEDLLNDISFQERDVIRILTLYGDKEIEAEVEVEGEMQTHTFKVSQVIEHELSSDAYQFTNPLYQLIFNEIVTANASDNFLDIKYFINHQHDEIRKFAIDVFETPYRLHNGRNNKYL